MGENILSVEELKTYFYTPSRTIKAVDGVSFCVKGGEIVGIVGESGCGKSVTALSILNLVPPPGRIVSGKIAFHDINLLSLNPEELRKIRGAKISMAFQEPSSYFNPVFSIGFQIAETIRQHRSVNKKEATDLSIEALKSVGFPSPAERHREYPHQMSGGMLQRAMLAMALCCNPEILIADEPTTALDVTIQSQILDLLKNICKERNTSILLITHDFGIIAETADTVVVMYAGKVLEKGTVREIFDESLHPYTRSLLESLATLGNKSEKKLSRRQEQKFQEDEPAGCVLGKRCPEWVDKCEQEDQVMTQKSPTHYVRCWRTR